MNSGGSMSQKGGKERGKIKRKGRNWEKLGELDFLQREGARKFDWGDAGQRGLY